MLTVIEDEEVIDRFLRAGASEVLSKSISLV
jgi:hypothetical protein